MIVDVLIEDPRWDAFQISDLAELTASAIFDHLDLTLGQHELALLACNDARICALNAEFRDKPTPTNVLSWPTVDLSAKTDGQAPQPPKLPDLGDIALAYETCIQEAQDQDKTVQDHVSHLIVHGVLHLLGYDHIRSKDAQLMEAQEKLILLALGIDDPYRDHPSIP